MFAYNKHHYKQCIHTGLVFARRSNVCTHVVFIYNAYKYVFEYVRM